MCKKMIGLVCSVLVLSLVGTVSAQLPAGWQSQDIGNPAPGSASEDGGTWTISGNGNDVWGSADAFHYAYVPLNGGGEITARVVDNGTGSNSWSKGGVMIRETLDADSKHCIAALTGGDGNGIAFQGRPTAGQRSNSFHGDISASPPHWVRLKREGNTITAFHSADGVAWEMFTDASPDGAHANPIDIEMANDIYIGLFVTSHATGELRTYTFDNVLVGLPVKAFGPIPENGSLHLDTWASCSWSPGHTAASHDVYFGESETDVAAGTGDTFQGNQGTTFFVVGFPGFPYPDGLVPGTTYYWRVDEVEADGVTVHTGPVWSFTVPPLKAYDPSPADGAGFVALDATLSWTAGFNSKLHTVYFGDDLDTVSNATGGIPQATTTYDPGLLEAEKTYYWRVDEFDGATTHTGNVWSFSTLPEIPITDPSLVGWWKFDEGMGNVALDWSGQGNNGAVQGDPQWVSGQVGGALEFDGIGDFVDCGANAVFNIDTDITVMCWIKVQQLDKTWQAIVTQGDNSWRLHRSGSTDNIAWGTSGLTPLDLTGTVNVYNGQWLHVAGVYNGSQKILYINGSVDASASSSGSINNSSYSVNIGENAQQTGRHWDGLIDDVRIYNRALTVEEIAEAMRGEPDLAWDPNPANGSTPDVTTALPLTWSAGDSAAQHDVYFTTDGDAVKSADESDTTGIYRGRQTATSYTPAEGVEWGGGPYYWRIDEVNTDGTISKGRIWSFTVADFLLVDDFEGYTDNDPEGEAIWQHWIDGFGVAGNGSQVGYLMPPYAEQTIVNNGNQSMPLMYNNTDGVTNSEAELALTARRDWTEQGVEELSLWFHGLPGSTGSFVVGPAGTYTINGSGADIWNNGPAGDRHDEFHYAYKTLTGAGSITARVVSVQNTNVWAKAGVMIRETLDGGSKHAFACVTPGSGVASQGRQDTGGDSFNTAESGITAPHWVKIERDMAGNFIVNHSADGSSWQPVQGAVPQNILMGSNVYIGLAVTSHDAALTCEAVFSNVTTTGNVSGQWQSQDIGIAANAAEPLYVAVSNASGAPAIVANADPAAAQIDDWVEWRIPLQDIADQGINLGNVDKIAIGLGSKSGMASAGGSGTMYIDDIRLFRP